MGNLEFSRLARLNMPDISIYLKFTIDISVNPFVQSENKTLNKDQHDSTYQISSHSSDLYGFTLVTAHSLLFTDVCYRATSNM